MRQGMQNDESGEVERDHFIGGLASISISFDLALQGTGELWREDDKQGRQCGDLHKEL